ncbi:hypothetical protein NHX12_004512 [Muraenolepis orangiensis]|uniref:DUF3456 domain-containing protein n=1 Tax=Muraenolepis orangiensis TaxID=630683 RepID=A0A9Q0DVM3_9TELE|nr:hypothetical protein NHX12_004512 [Muraenolepis orangiensis]
MASWRIQITAVMLLLSISLSHQKKDPVLYCSACRAIADELSYSINQVDPKKMINVGGFRLSADGTLKDKKVQHQCGLSTLVLDPWPLAVPHSGCFTLTSVVFSPGRPLSSSGAEGEEPGKDPGEWKNIPPVTVRGRHRVPLARSETYLSELVEGVCGSMSDYAPYVDPNTKVKSYTRFAPRGKDGFPDIENFQFGDGVDTTSALKFACETIVEDLEDDIISLFSRGTERDVARELCSGVSDYCKDGTHANEEL